jgi:hypothetical protein
VEVSNEGCWQAEILRLKALMLMGGRVPDSVSARAALEKSLGVAQAQGAVAWRLRSLTTCCQLWPNQAEPCTQLQATVQQIRGWLGAGRPEGGPGGFTPDVLNLGPCG